VAAYDRSFTFPGPNLDETEEEILDALQTYLAERHIDDQMAEFVGQYTCWVEQLEYERWLKDLKTFIQA
jgi:complement component 1 Q subcomponent-binding protein